MPVNSSSPVRLKTGAYVDVLPGSGDFLDCRRFFVGDHHRKLIRAHSEAFHLLEQTRRNPRAAESLKQSAEVAQFYEISVGVETAGVTLRETVFREPGPQFELQPQLELRSRGQIWRRALPLEHLAALGLLLPLLLGAHGEQEVADLLARHDRESASAAIAILEWLASNGLLESAPTSGNGFPPPNAGSRLTFLGHTSLLVQTPANAVLFDPIFLPDYGHYSRARGVARLKLTAINLSHSHWDHCHPQTLLWFDKSTPLIIPRVERPTAFNPPLANMLRALGFHDIREAALWKPIQLGEIELVPTPFHGEQDEPGAEIDHYTSVVRTPGFTLFGGVDCFRDTFGEMPPVLERIRDEFQPDIAALPVSKMVFAYRDGGVNGYCRKLDTSLLDVSYQYTAGPTDAAQWAKLLGARWVFGYASFVFGRWSAPPVLQQFRMALRALGIERVLFPLYPFDRLDFPIQRDSLSLALRRRLRLAGLRRADLVHRADLRLARFAPYRAARRIWRRLFRAASAHHH